MAVATEAVEAQAEVDMLAVVAKCHSEDPPNHPSNFEPTHQLLQANHAQHPEVMWVAIKVR